MGAYENPVVPINRKTEVWGQLAINLGNMASKYITDRSDKMLKAKEDEEKNNLLRQKINMQMIDSKTKGLSQIQPVIKTGAFLAEINNAADVMRNANMQLSTRGDLLPAERDGYYADISNYESTIADYKLIGDYIQGGLAYIQNDENGAWGKNWIFTNGKASEQDQEYIFWTSMSGLNNEYTRDVVKDKNGGLVINFKDSSGKIAASKSMEQLKALAVTQTRLTSQIENENVMAAKMLDTLNITEKGVFNVANIDSASTTRESTTDKKSTFATQFLSETAQLKITSAIQAQASADLSGTPDEIEHNLRTLWNYTFKNAATNPFEEWYNNKDNNHEADLIREYQQSAAGVMKMAVDEKGIFYKTGGVTKNPAKTKKSSSYRKPPPPLTEVGSLKTNFGYGTGTAEAIVGGQAPYNETIALLETITNNETLLTTLNDLDTQNEYMTGKELLILGGKMDANDTETAMKKVAKQSGYNLNSIYIPGKRKAYDASDTRLLEKMLFRLNGGTAAQLKAIKGHLGLLKERKKTAKKDFLAGWLKDNPGGDINGVAATVAYRAFLNK